MTTKTKPLSTRMENLLLSMVAFDSDPELVNEYTTHESTRIAVEERGLVVFERRHQAGKSGSYLYGRRTLKGENVALDISLARGES